MGMIAGAAIGAGASIFGASKASSAANNAANAQVKAEQIAADTQKSMFGEAKNALSPFMGVGYGAAADLQKNFDSLTAPVPVPGPMDEATLQATPGYQFTLGQGLKSTQNSAAARGLGVSGAALKGAATYATGLSDQTYNTRFNQNQQNWLDAVTNRNDSYNKMLGTTQMGEQAAGALAGQAIQTGQGVAQSQTGAGSAQAAGINAGGQAWASGIQGVGNSFNNALSQYMYGGQTGGMYGNGNTTGSPNSLYKALNGGY